MKKKFVYEFDDASGGRSLSFNMDVVSPARIQLRLDSKEGFSFIANSEGWLHMARICAEMGLGDFETGFHFHLDASFDTSPGPPEFTFVRDNRPTF